MGCHFFLVNLISSSVYYTLVVTLMLTVLEPFETEPQSNPDLLSKALYILDSS